MYQTEQTCTKTDGQASSGSKLNGPEHDFNECLAGCDSNADCTFVTFSSRGYCKFYSACGNRQARPGVVILSRDADVATPPPTPADGAGDDFLIYRRNQLCTRSLEQQTTSSVLQGNRHDLADCAHVCRVDASCAFFSRTKGGACRFFGTCDDVYAKNEGVIYRRTDTPPVVTVEVSVLEATDIMCERNNDQKLSGPNGKGHSVQFCESRCAAKSTCTHFTVTRPGWCRLFKTCAAQVSLAGGRTYRMTEDVEGDVDEEEPEPPSVDAFALLQYNAMCDLRGTDRRVSGSLNGGDHSVNECQESCAPIADCNFFVLTSKGFCRLFLSCNQRVAKTDALIFARISTEEPNDPADPAEDEEAEEVETEPPTMGEFATGAQCRRIDTQIASRFGIAGSGNSFETCSSRCLRTADCRFMSRSARGWCRFFSGCDDVVHYDNAAAWITYSRQIANQDSSDGSRVAAQVLPNQPVLAGASCVGGAQRASTVGLDSTVDLEGCRAGCSDVEDCAFFVHTNNGRCKFFNSCDRTLFDLPASNIYAV